ncbi:hypothetical protein HBI08_235190 [Parastagonospora nodorum]|nr:hypothetical protein HBI08_235190 [Parastagonospora nodorum]
MVSDHKHRTHHDTAQPGALCASDLLIFYNCNANKIPQVHSSSSGTLNLGTSPRAAEEPAQEDKHNPKFAVE